LWNAFRIRDRPYGTPSKMGGENHSWEEWGLSQWEGPCPKQAKGMQSQLLHASPLMHLNPSLWLHGCNFPCSLRMTYIPSPLCPVINSVVPLLFGTGDWK
jgi:hypothetical protein